MQSRSNGTYDRNEPWALPTQEDVLEVNFWAIVSDCRGLYNGTLQPRPWADLADTWIETPRETKLYRIRKKRRNNYVEPREKPIVITPVRVERPRRVKKDYGLPVPRHFTKMVHILMANGDNVWDARLKAKALLGKRR